VDLVTRMGFQFLVRAEIALTSPLHPEQLLGTKLVSSGYVGLFIVSKVARV
jgi:hypothetical protein